MERVLVTGGTGFTGSYLCKLLREKGYPVRALVRANANTAALINQGVICVTGDLADPGSLKDLLKDIDIVFHVAALYRTEGVSKAMFTQVNVEGTHALLEEAVAAGVKRFVHCSTVGVQGEIANPPATEDAPFNPGDHYQISKLEGELLARSYHDQGKLEVVTVRPVGIYGPGDTRFLKLFRHIYKGNFRMIGSGRALYHLTYVEDLCEGIVLAGFTPSAAGRVYTIGGNEYLPLSELVQLLAQIMEKRVSKFHIPLWPVYMLAVCCEGICRPLGIEPPIYRRRLDFFTKDRAFDITRAKTELLYAPRVSLKEGLTRTARWYKENGWLD